MNGDKLRGADLLLSIAADQAGVLTRAQAFAAGMTQGQVRWQLATGRWQRLHPGVYATFDGPLPPVARLWAAVLHGGEGAALTGPTALWVSGLRSPVISRDNRIHLTVPATRVVMSPPGIVVRRARTPRTTTGSPPRVSVEVAALDALDRVTRDEQVVQLVLGLVQQRLTTPGRLAEALDARLRQRHRGLVLDLIGEAQDGVRSPLERRYRNGVERAHGLPHATFNKRELTDGGRSVYRDADYAPWPLLVELDGRAAHPLDEAHRDRRRDNTAMAGGRFTLRYGWFEVECSRCAVAGEVGGTLTGLGWDGRPRRCGPTCEL